MSLENPAVQAAMDNPDPESSDNPLLPAQVPGRPTTARPVFMPETFSGVGRDWSDWLGQFEIAAEVNNWDDALKLKFMSLLLSGRARDMYSGLSVESRTSYVRLKEALGRCLEPSDSDDWNRASFLSRRRQPNETAREFGNALRRLIMKAYPSADNHTRDLFARDHFIEHVGNGDLRISLRTAKPQTLEGAINLAAELELIRSLEQTRLHTDTQVRAIEKSSPSEDQMKVLLGVVEGLRQEVKALQGAVQASRPSPSTHAQGTSLRHNTTQAPGRLDQGRRGEVCYECGCNRHFRRDCPYLATN